MPSVQALVTRFLMQRVLKPWLMSDDVMVTRKRFAQLASPPRMVPAVIEPIDAGGVPAEWLTPRGADPQRVLYYLHGGGFVACSLATHRRLAARIARDAGMRALIVDYRLAPEHPFPAGLDDALIGYRYLLASGIRPEQIVVAGDSAGGTLTLGLLLTLRDRGEPLPAAGICISPATDMTQSGESFQLRHREEAMLSQAFCRKIVPLYLSGMSAPNPLASPLHAELKGLPPLLIHVGTHELLFHDATRFAEAAQAAGVDATIKIWDGMWHVFHAMDVPESRAAVRELAEFARART
jgi:epsilon-lactone hydrolase